MTQEKLPEMPLTEHLRELRYRLIVSIVAFLIGSGIAFYFAKYVFEILKDPVLKSYPDVELITLSPTEPLFILIKISLAVGFIIASPVILYQFWRFIEPALYSHEKRAFIPLFLGSILLFILGALFAYFIVLPLALKFLLGLGFTQLLATPYLSVDMYVSFVLKLVIAFGIAFEMPIVLYILQKAGLVTPEQLTRFRKYFIVIAFVIGAIIAPDVSTQVLMALPLLLLYEISIFLGKLATKKRREIKKL